MTTALKRILPTLTALLLVATAAAAPQELRSPDGKLRLGVSLTEAGEPCYALDYDSRPVILPSKLGFELRGDLNVSEIEIEGDRIRKRDAHPADARHHFVRGPAYFRVGRAAGGQASYQKLRGEYLVSEYRL